MPNRDEALAIALAIAAALFVLVLALPEPAQPAAATAGMDASCAEWTNGCTICARQPDGAPGCSTPGIACQPGPPRCLRR